MKSTFLLIAGVGLLALPSSQSFAQTPGTLVDPITAAKVNPALGTKADATNGVLNSATLNGATLSNPSVTGTAGAFFTGNGGDVSYPPRGLVAGNQGLAARSGTAGCQDQAVALSAIGTSSALVTPGYSAHAGVNGGCQAGLSSLASYGSFDGVTFFQQMFSPAPTFAINGPTYTATRMVMPAGTTLSAAQLSLLSPWMYILTNSVDSANRPYGSYVSSWDANGINVVGWTPLGGGATSASVPSTTYQAGTGSTAITWVGQPNNLFTENQVCSWDGNPAVRRSVCGETDVINNSSAYAPDLDGISILGFGPGANNGLYIAGQAGPSSGFQSALYIANFRPAGSGITVTQPSGSGGVGFLVGMTQGEAIQVLNNATSTTGLFVDYTGHIKSYAGMEMDLPAQGGYFLTGKNNTTNEFSIDTSGNAVFLGAVSVGAALTSTGTLQTTSGFRVTGSTAGYAVAVQNGTSNLFLVDSLGNAAVGARLSVGGGLSASGSGGISFTNLPKSSSGLSSGTIWNNSGVLNVIP